MKRRTGILLALGLVVLAGAVVAGLLLAPRNAAGPLSRITGAASQLRDYVGAQIVGVVNAHLVPQIDFETIDYEAPGTVRLGGVTLTSPEGDRILDVDTLVVTLSEIPQRDKPIKISRIDVEGGRVSLIVDPETGSIKGLLPFVKRSPLEPDEVAQQQPVPDDLRLSSVLRLEHVSVTDLLVEYDDGSGAERLALPGLHLEMDIVPATESAGDAPGGDGWYEIAFNSGRRPGLELDVRGRFSIDTLTLWTRDASARIDLSPETVSSLPQSLSAMLTEHDVRGDADVTLSGSIPLREPLSAQANATIAMTGASFASGEFRLPVDRLDASLALSNGLLSLSRLDAQLLRGTLSAFGDARFAEQARPASLSATLTGIDLEQLLRASAPDGEDPSLAGLLSGQVNATGSLRSADALGGSGTLKVREGILVRTPGLSALADASDVESLTKPGQRTHEADVEFDLTHEGAQITAGRLETPTMLARGVGLVGFDQTLDLRVNAGPLEKLQGLLGQAGKLIGKLTDQLVTYRVTGTISEPSVSVAPLGIEVSP